MVPLLFCPSYIYIYSDFFFYIRIFKIEKRERKTFICIVLYLIYMREKEKEIR